MKRLAILFALLTLAAATPAQAQEVTGHPTAGHLNWSAYNWWAHGYGRVGCHPAYMRIYLTGGAAQSDWGCQIWLNAGLWNAAHSGPMDGYRISMRHDLCSQMVHERGHSAGLGHAPGWVMDPNRLYPIGMCANWARYG